MRFAPLLRGASRVEIAEDNILKARIGAVVREDLFEDEFRFAVRVDRRFAMIFRNGNDFRFAIRGRRGRKDEFVNAVANHGVEKVHAASDVGRVERAGFADRLGDKRLAREVHDRIDFVLSENLLDLQANGEIDLNKRGSLRNCLAMALYQIVEGDDLVAAAEKHFRADATNVASGSSDENVQQCSPSIFKLSEKRT